MSATLFRNLISIFKKDAIFKYKYTYKGKKSRGDLRVILPISLIVIGLILYALPKFLPVGTISVFMISSAKILLIPLKFINGLFGFALFEICIILIIPFFIWAILYERRTKDKEKTKTMTSILASVLGLMIITFSISLGAGYYSEPLEETLELRGGEVNLKNITDATYYIADMASTTRALAYESGEPSLKVGDYYPHIKETYKRLGEENDVFKGMTSRPKAAIFSVPMSYLGISGMYSPFTSEALINVNTTPPAMPFTIAHEVAHSLFISREDEANFMGFITCIESDDAYTAYSGYFNALLYLRNSLYKADPNEYAVFNEQLDPQIKADIEMYFDHIDQYDGIADEIQDKVNDAYLKSNGQEEGTQSYGAVVELLVKWYDVNF